MALILAAWGGALPARADEFVMPSAGEVFIKGSGGTGGARSNFGLGSTIADFHPYLSNLPAQTTEVDLGHFDAGQVVPFAMISTFDRTEYAFSTDSVTPGSRTAFMDLDNSLGYGGSVIHPIATDTYRLFLDDANSYRFDDNDHDLLVDVRVAPDAGTAAPLPPGVAGGALTAAALLVGSAVTARRRRIAPPD
jgi:hypothetical protein